MRSEEIITKALNLVDNDRYKLSLMVAKRAEQLAAGAEPLIQNSAKLKNVDIALREIADGKVVLDGITQSK